MRDRKPADASVVPQSGDDGAKRPYVKPAFRHEQVFETMALACGKISTGAACKANKKTS